MEGRGLRRDHRRLLSSVDERSLRPSVLARLPASPQLREPSGGISGALILVTSFFPQVEKLVKYLDPNDLGRINFKDFCRGVFAMKGKAFWGKGSRASQDPVQQRRLT